MTRTRRILNIVKEKGCDAAVFADAVNIRYASGYDAPDGILVITEKRSVLFVDYRYNELKPDREGFENELPELRVTNSPLTKAAAEVLRSVGAKKVAVDTSVITCDMFEKFTKNFLDSELVGISGICSDMRSAKDEYEIDMIKKAQKITEDAFDYVLGKINPEMTENELAAELEYFIRKRGGALAFDTIAISGERTAVPHGTPRNVKLANNSFITMDFGARWKGYCSDMTRTVVLGKADDEMKQVYYTVLEAQKLGIEAARAGIKGYEADAAARNHIEACGYGEYFTHSLGHSVGLYIHETPGFAKTTTAQIPENAVVTVEPGIYIPGRYGVRIEDMVIVKANGAEDITKSPKDLIEI